MIIIITIIATIIIIIIVVTIIIIITIITISTITTVITIINKLMIIIIIIIIIIIDGQTRDHAVSASETGRPLGRGSAGRRPMKSEGSRLIGCRKHYYYHYY